MASRWSCFGSAAEGSKLTASPKDFWDDFLSWLVIGIEVGISDMTNDWKWTGILFPRISESFHARIRALGLETGIPSPMIFCTMISFRVPGWWWRFATKGADGSRCIFFLNKSWNILKDTEVSWSWHRMTLSCLVGMCKFNGKSQLFVLSGIGKHVEETSMWSSLIFHPILDLHERNRFAWIFLSSSDLRKNSLQLLESSFLQRKPEFEVWHREPEDSNLILEIC